MVDPRIESATVVDDMLTMHLEDGRVVSVPVAFYWRLAEATGRQLQRFEVLPNRRGIHWPDIDVDISIRGVLSGAPAERPGQEAAITVDVAAERLGIAARTLRKTITRMSDEGFQIGETRGRYRTLSGEELEQVVRWREAHSPGRPTAPQQARK